MLAFLPIAPAVVGDRVTLPDVGEQFVVARCGAESFLALACLSCRQRLANPYQLDAHLETAPDQPHVIVRQCGEHGWEPWIFDPEATMPFSGPEKHLHDGERRRMSGRQCAALQKLAETPVRVVAGDDARRLVGSYATNILTALEERGLIAAAVPGSDHGWTVTLEGRAVAALLAPVSFARAG